MLEFFKKWWTNQRDWWANWPTSTLLKKAWISKIKLKSSVISTPLIVSKKLVKAGSLKLQDLSSMKSFAEKFIVKKELVLTAVRHLYENSMAANLRRNDRKEGTRQRKQKKFADYDWKGMTEERKLDSLYVYELDKYLKKHNITLKKRTKVDKIQSIIYY